LRPGFIGRTENCNAQTYRDAAADHTSTSSAHRSVAGDGDLEWPISIILIHLAHPVKIESWKLSLLLFIPFGAVVGFAEHLAILNVGCAALAPGAHVVGIHFGQLPDSGLIAVVTQCAEWAIGDSFLLRRLGLCSINRFFRGFVIGYYFHQTLYSFFYECFRISGCFPPQGFGFPTQYLGFPTRF
jgi:hypothetical protein